MALSTSPPVVAEIGIREFVELAPELPWSWDHGTERWAMIDAYSWMSFSNGVTCRAGTLGKPTGSGREPAGASAFSRRTSNCRRSRVTSLETARAES